MSCARKKIDLGEVKAAKKALQQIAKEHPELLGESSAENVKGWEAHPRGERDGKRQNDAGCLSF